MLGKRNRSTLQHNNNEEGSFDAKNKKRSKINESSDPSYDQAEELKKQKSAT